MFFHFHFLIFYFFIFYFLISHRFGGFWQRKKNSPLENRGGKGKGIVMEKEESFLKQGE
jgi:hypothetical protein